MASGKVKYDAEIKKMCKQAITGSKDSKDKETRILDAFKAWDKDKNGVITKDELSVVLTSLGCSTKPEDLEVMLKEADLDSDGKINYEEMVQWLCRAPHLEQYFLLSLDIFKRNFKDVDAEVLSVQREMQKMQKEFDAGPPDDETAAMKKCFDIMQQLLKQMEAVQRSTQKRIDDELTPVIKRSFKYHDKDGSGTLSYDEGIIFFSNFISLWEPFGELMSELNCAQVAMMDRIDSEAEDENLDHTKDLAQKKVKLVTPDKLHKAFKKKYAVLKGEHASQMDAHHKAAFELLGPGGKVTEAAVLEALLHGHEKNSEFLDAMGLGVQDVMKAAEPTCIMLRDSLENIREALNEVNQSASEMASMKLDVPVMPVGESDGPDDCQVQ
mmetsp:Transcript_6267/g.12891  ORF Transcript_6267/g.12891 Transcript_6267/m.12891 type:complete len:383 (+) Transcript_6267:56-1204(+)